jgi:Domain of unknown function (DUF1963)
LDWAGLSRHRDALVALARRSVRLVPELAEERELPHGTSRIGGRPDLPATTQWPLFDDAPLSFVAQINLAETHDDDAANLLPAEACCRSSTTVPRTACGGSTLPTSADGRCSK